MKFGSVKPKTAANILFWTGLAAVLLVSAYLGWQFSAKTVWQSLARDFFTNEPKVPITTHSLPCAILWGLGSFAVLGVIWRIICEAFFLKLDILREVYLKKQNNA